MQRRKIPGLIDLYEVSDPAEIEALARDPLLDRKFGAATCPINWLLLKRSLKALSFGGRRFPTMLPREDAERARKQQELWTKLSEQAAAMRTGPADLEPLAHWVRGTGSGNELETDEPGIDEQGIAELGIAELGIDELGILVQQLLGRLFSDNFVATPQSWAAAKVLVAAPRSNNLPRMAWWFASGKVRRAKRFLAGMVADDLSAVNAIGIAAHNVVKSLRHMRLLYADAAARSGLTPAVAVEQSLFAPVNLFRQATAAGELGGCPFPRDALFVLSIGAASRQATGRSLVFMDDTWSQCPANLWVPAMLEGVWQRACVFG